MKDRTARPMPAELNQDLEGVAAIGTHLSNADRYPGRRRYTLIRHLAVQPGLRGAAHHRGAHGAVFLITNHVELWLSERRIAVSIHVALNHVTHYRYDRPVGLSPQIVR